MGQSKEFLRVGRTGKAPALFVTAMVLVGISSVSVADTSMEKRLQRLEQNFQRLQQRVERQDKVIAKQQDTIAEQRNRLQEQAHSTEYKPKKDAASEWWQGVEMSGVIELEAGYVDPYAGEHESDLVVATAEIGIAAQITDWVAGEITLLYEEDDTDLEVDVASITIANAERTPFSFTAGQTYVPFGAFETGAISDPLTLEIGETRETIARIGFETRGWSGSVFAFNGDVDADAEDDVDQFGANLGFTAEFGEDANAAVGISYISSLGDSDSLQDVLITTSPGTHTGAWSAFANVNLGSWTFIGEYLSATEEFGVGTLAYNGSGAKPSAWNLEMDYGFNIFGRPASIAFAYQGTDEALGLGLPETRYLLAASTELDDNTTISLEWAHDRDYGASDTATTVDGVITGTGNSADTITLQLAVEF